MDQPTNEHKALLAHAALDAFYAKAGELGLPRLYGLAGKRDKAQQRRAV